MREFLERDLGPEGLARSVVIVVTSDESAVMRAKGAETAMTIAEWFREADQEVLFLMDSATRYAMSLREIGLAAGERLALVGPSGAVKTTLLDLLARIFHEARSEGAESAAASRPSDRRPPEAYSTVRRGRPEGEGREDAVLSASSVERS